MKINLEINNNRKINKKINNKRRENKWMAHIFFLLNSN
jgi:hypothetical protein